MKPERARLAAVSIASGPPEEVRGWSDAWVLGSDEADESLGVGCYLLSLVGSPLAVRSLQSAFLANPPLELARADGKRVRLRPAHQAIYRTRWSRLPSGALHALLVADLSEGPSPAERLILAPSEAALPDALFADLFTHRGLMAFPEWRRWLLRHLLETGGARRLTGPVPASRPRKTTSMPSSRLGFKTLTSPSPTPRWPLADPRLEDWPAPSAPSGQLRADRPCFARCAPKMCPRRAETCPKPDPASQRGKENPSVNLRLTEGPCVRSALKRQVLYLLS